MFMLLLPCDNEEYSQETERQRNTLMAKERKWVSTKRKTPLKRSTKPIKRSAIKRKPKVKKTKEERTKANKVKKGNPYSRFWRDMCEKHWRAIILYRQGYKSILSGLAGKQIGGTHLLCVHHLLPRARGVTRWDLSNGVLLTKREHSNFHDYGPHGSENFHWAAFLMEHYPDRWRWMKDHKHDSGRMNWQEKHDELLAIAKAEIPGY